ncbi:MAG: hypothetical protein JJE39_02330 [Vicinamibacteria bacterium]|nr:hypothetical protein [Vicinamibacteria bacterium]
MIPVILAAVAAGVVVLVFGRFDRNRALRRWDFVLSGQAEKATETLRDRLAEDTEIAGHTYDLALKRKASLSYDEAVRLLAIAADTIEEAAEDRQRRLRALSVYARMAEAIVPVPPVRPSQFKLAEMRSLTGIATWLHELLNSYQERFRFRLAVIGFGIRLVVRSIRGSRTRASIEPTHAEPYQTFGDSLHDFRALDHEQVESFRQLMRSAAATDRQTLPEGLRSLGGDAHSEGSEKKLEK